jgi:hypothetical protein
LLDMSGLLFPPVERIYHYPFLSVINR